MSFVDRLFPLRISQGARGGPAYPTTITIGTSRREMRNIEVPGGQIRWDVNHAFRNPAERDELIDFWRTMRGPAYSFRFRDPSDRYAGMYWSGQSLVHCNGLSTAPEVLAAVPDGIETEFQMTKTYGSAFLAEVRTITKVADPASLRYFGAVDLCGAAKIWQESASNPGEFVEISSGFTIDRATGVVTFDVAPAAGRKIGWSGFFDFEARFDMEQIPLEMDLHYAGGVSLQVLEVLG